MSRNRATGRTVNWQHRIKTDSANWSDRSPKSNWQCHNAAATPPLTGVEGPINLNHLWTPANLHKIHPISDGIKVKIRRRPKHTNWWHPSALRTPPCSFPPSPLPPFLSSSPPLLLSYLPTYLPTYFSLCLPFHLQAALQTTLGYQ